jgi:ATP phosphoribosyltransferase regulatory subunit
LPASIPAPATLSSARLSASELSHPLPSGMRDFLPPDARRLAELSAQLLGTFELYGYELVTLPVFEYESVLERGLGTLDADEVLRFVEPETGQVVALRPDMTPQLARVASTRLSQAAPPIRLSYQGSVLRRRRERARRHRQIFQAGIELIGLDGPSGDLEALEVACSAARAVGLEDFVLDLGHARIAFALLEGVEPARQRAAVEALHLKDRAELERAAAAAGLSAREQAALSALSELHGGREILQTAAGVLAGTRAEAGLEELSRVVLEVEARGLAPALVVDLGETRNFAYYTGTTFQLHAHGPGVPVASGGRYDGLLGGFGRPLPAFGFAFGLDDLVWALGSAALAPPRPRVLLGAGAAHLASGLRQLGVRCALAPAQDPLAYAKGWRYTHFVSTTANEAVVTSVPDLAEQRAPLDAALLARVLVTGT